MKKQNAFHSLAAALLLTAAALPLSALAAQDAQAPVDVTPPPAPAAPAQKPAQTPPVVAVPSVEAPADEPATAVEAASPAADEAPAARQARAPRARPRPATQPRVQAPIAGVAPAAPQPDLFAPATPPPAPVAEFPEAAPAPALEAVPASPPPVAEAAEGNDNGPLLLVGALALAGIGAVLLARRRRRPGRSYDDYRTSGDPRPAAAVASAPVPIAAAAAPAALAEPGRPWLELLMRPVRAGVGEEDARVEFELCVDNKGSAPAQDVRISTFMLAADSAQEAEIERTLVERPSEARLPDAIEPGDAKRIAAAVVLPRHGLPGAILPVVVAEALYRLPDGNEGRTTVSFAVGVPFEGELAHFDVENPSGLHEGVEARPHREPQRS